MNNRYEIAREFAKTINSQYIIKIILFGSVARHEDTTESDIEIFFNAVKPFIKDIKRVWRALKLTSPRVLKTINKRLTEKYIDTVDCMKETLMMGVVTVEYLEEHKEEFDADKKKLAEAVINAVLLKDILTGMQEFHESIVELKRGLDRVRISAKYAMIANKKGLKDIEKRSKEAAREVKKFNKRNPGVLEEFEVSLEGLSDEAKEAVYEENPELSRMMLLNIIAGRHKSE